MTLLIVSPLHNEVHNVSGLVSTVREQRFRDFDWVVVDDGSSDGTAEEFAKVDTDHLATVLTKANDGGLIGGSDFSSWRFGVAHALPRKPYSHVMKLDADVRLAPDYLDRVMKLARGRVGIAGGVIVTKGMTEQKFHVPGSVKLYTTDAFRATASMPTALGWDVLDEVAASLAGFETRVDSDAHFEMTRAVGASEERSTADTAMVGCVGGPATRSPTSSCIAAATLLDVRTSWDHSRCCGATSLQAAAHSPWR